MIAQNHLLEAYDFKLASPDALSGAHIQRYVMRVTLDPANADAKVASSR